MDLQDRLAHPRLTFGGESVAASKGPEALISPVGWARLARSLGHDPDGWQAKEMRHPEHPGRNALFLLTAPDGVSTFVLKVFRNDTPDRAGEQIAGLWSGLQRLSGHPTARLPTLHAVAPGDNAIVMEYVPGPCVQDILSTMAAAEDRMLAVEGCALWLQANMEAGPVVDLPLPKGKLGRRLERLSRGPDADSGAIWQMDAYAAFAAATRAAAEALPPHNFAAGARHGDANPGNFILHPDGLVYGLDPLRPVTQHICQDLGYLIARALPFLWDGDAPLPVGPSLRDALALSNPMAAATSVCLRAELLGVWRRSPIADFHEEKSFPKLIKTLVEGDGFSSVDL